MDGYCGWIWNCKHPCSARVLARSSSIRFRARLSPCAGVENPVVVFLCAVHGGLDHDIGGARHGGHGVFTFAVLDALGRADANSNGLVEFAELIQHVDWLVPAITEKHWGARQFPQMDAYGSNFPLPRQVAALAPDQGDAIIIPLKPTRVNSEALQVFKETDGKLHKLN
jgi:hypothetical protein